ncbi:MAG: helix-turn-helix transcriptional regulator [Bacteroidota bacterium]|nr:helix-turn-helix transcriptional regulator [Bacteroidota bacterium]
MIKHEELVKSPEYWFESIQNEIFRQVDVYLKDNNMTQTQLAEQLGVSKGYVSQVMKGEFNYTLKKLIELSLAVGKVPVLEFKPLTEVIQAGNEQVVLSTKPSLDKVAEPIAPYKINTQTNE